MFDNDGFTVDGGTIVAPPDDERLIRMSLASTFPNVEGGPINATAVGGIVLEGNATLDEQSAGTEKVVEILDTANLEGFDLTITGSPVYLAEINDYLKGGMFTLGLAALAVMAVILLLIFRVRWRLLPLLAVSHRRALVVLAARPDRHRPVARHDLRPADPDRARHRLRDPDPQPGRRGSRPRPGGPSDRRRRSPTSRRR